MPTKSKTPAPLTARHTVSEAFAAILEHNLAYLVQWEQAARSSADIEGVHQIRVSFRRMRSAISLFRNAVSGEASNHWNEEMRWLAGQLGLARDLDVFIDETLNTLTGKLPLSGEEKLMELAIGHRDRVYRDEVCAMLDSERYTRFKADFKSWCKEKAWEESCRNKKQQKRLGMNLVAYSRKLLDKQERRVLAAGSHVDTNSATEMHRLRIECKKLRYAAEFFRPVFAGMDTFIGKMKGLQDLLGVMNDVAVLQQLLDILLADCNEHQTLVYSGGLVGWRTCHFHHLLVSFDRYWDEFVEAKHPWWKKSAVL
jgi:CHAD domain-containing protein